MLLQRTRLLSDIMAISAVPVPINLECLGQVVWCCCQGCIYLRLRHLASWQSPLTRQYSSKRWNQESEQSSATIVSVVADMTRQ